MIACATDAAQRGRRLLDTMAQVIREREAQDLKWGEQNHASVDMRLALRSNPAARLALEYEIPTEERAKFNEQTAAKRGETTWAHIAIEELAEAVGCGHDDGKRRVELIQLAAVVFAWIDCIDRHKGKAPWTSSSSGKSASTPSPGSQEPSPG